MRTLCVLIFCAFLLTPAWAAPGVAVLEYHHFIPDGEAATHPDHLTDMTMSASQLGAQLDWLSAHGAHPLSVAQLADHIAGTRPAPPRSFVVTIDDGYESVFTVAWPRFAAHRVPVDLALIVLATEDPTQWQRLHPGALPHLSWAQVQQMMGAQGGRSLVTVDSHTYNKHEKLATMAAALPASERPGFYQALTADFWLARRLIEKHTAQPALGFIWPHGDGSPALERVAEDAGHTATYYGPEKVVFTGASPLRIGRFNVGSGLLKLPDFEALLRRSGWLTGAP